MGIPRLSQDVAPFAEPAIIGHSQEANIAHEIKRLVIDGPSLVYHVFNALLHNSTEPRTEYPVGLPPYAQINACLFQFLENLITSGAQICKIIFDGALPCAKRATRLDRLEKTRHNLDNYRKLETYGGPRTHPGLGNPCRSSIDLNYTQIHKILWVEHTVTSAKLHLLPPPPFMVASVIETLKESKFASITEVVPGEADVYCAFEAKRSAAAILTNDSDLLLYNFGIEASVVMLRTLSCLDTTEKATSVSIVGQCLRPVEIAKKLNVPTLMLFGHHRSRGPSVSTSIIAQRARENSSTQSGSEWDIFQTEYTLSASESWMHNQQATRIYHAIQELDPRTSELVYLLSRREPGYVYLPVVLEDPTRDPSWSYSIDLRSLAYSIIFDCYNVSQHRLSSSDVLEYSRKGSRIGRYQVQKLSRSMMHERLKTIAELIEFYSDKSNGEITNSAERSERLEHRNRDLVTEDYVFLRYCLFAADIVISQRLSKSRSYQPSFSRLYPLNGLSTLQNTAMTWDDIHFHATTQCTLYSLRILRQALGHAAQIRPTSHSTEMQGLLDRLSRILTNMPAITSLFVDADAFRSKLANYPPQLVANGVRKLISRIDPASLSLVESWSTPRESLVAEVNRQKHIEDDWQETKASSKKRKTDHTMGSRQNNISTKQTTSNHKQHTLTSNSFALLQAIEDSSGSDNE